MNLSTLESLRRSALDAYYINFDPYDLTDPDTNIECKSRLLQNPTRVELTCYAYTQDGEAEKRVTLGEPFVISLPELETLSVELSARMAEHLQTCRLLYQLL